MMPICACIISPCSINEAQNHGFISTGVLFLIEGCGQYNLAKNWGDGIASDSGLISSLGLSDTNPFFRTLLNKPYLNQVVAAPHIYPPSISKATDKTTVSLSAQTWTNFEEYLPVKQMPQAMQGL